MPQHTHIPYQQAAKRGYTLLSPYFSPQLQTFLQHYHTTPQLLDMWSLEHCLLCHLFGHYHTGIEVVKPYFTVGFLAPHYGFRIPARLSIPETTLEDTKTEYEYLTLAWQEYLSLGQ